MIEYKIYVAGYNDLSATAKIAIDRLADLYNTYNDPRVIIDKENKHCGNNLIYVEDSGVLMSDAEVRRIQRLNRVVSYVSEIVSSAKIGRNF